MEFPKVLDSLSIEELLEIAKKPGNIKERKNLSKLKHTEIVGLFLKEKGFKPYRRKLIHYIIIYDEYLKWSNEDETILTQKQFLKALSYWYVPVLKNKTSYFYTRYKGLRNSKLRIKAIINELKKQKEQRSSEEE